MKAHAPTLSIVPLLRYRRIALSPEVTVLEARRLFRRHPRLYHLPVVDEEGRYRWLLPKKALARQAPYTLLLTLPLKEVTPLTPQATIYDALQLMHQYKTPEIPTTDDENHYLGLLTADALIQWWSQLGAVQERGSVLVLEADLHDYSLSHIAHIVESEHAQILSAYLLSHEAQPHKAYIVLKINTPYLNSIVSLLEREKYQLVSAHGDPALEKNTRDQIDFLRRLMNL
jgi:CBS-domain-containing membrane protein